MYPTCRNVLNGILLLAWSLEHFPKVANLSLWWISESSSPFLHIRFLIKHLIDKGVFKITSQWTEVWSCPPYNLYSTSISTLLTQEKKLYYSKPVLLGTFWYIWDLLGPTSIIYSLRHTLIQSSVDTRLMAHYQYYHDSFWNSHLITICMTYFVWILYLQVRYQTFYVSYGIPFSSSLSINTTKLLEFTEKGIWFTHFGVWKSTLSSIKISQIIPSILWSSTCKSPRKK